VKRFPWKGVLFLSAVVCLLCFNSVYGVDKEEVKLSLFVSILPQAYFVERVGGSHVEVEVLVGPGQSPATFELTPQQMAKLTQADAYFRIGLPFEKRLVGKIQAALSGLRVVDTRQGIQLRTMEHEHHNDGSDPHIWLDPMLVKVQAATVCEELCRLDPVNATVYKQNLKAFKADLDEVDARLTQALEPLRGRKFYVFHPSYGYFGDAYGLTQVAVEVEGKEPGARRLAALIDQAKEDSVKVIFVQPQFSAGSAEAVAQAIGGVVVPIDPLARDYLKNLEDIAEKIVRGLAKAGK
jgi:zinc transport system substrate-binding protein